MQMWVVPSTNHNIFYLVICALFKWNKTKLWFDTHQEEKAYLLSFFLSSSFSCFCSWHFLPSSLCFRNFSLSFWSCSSFHFSYTWRFKRDKHHVVHNKPAVSPSVHLFCRLLPFFLLVGVSLLLPQLVLLFFGFRLETLCFTFFPSLICCSCSFLLVFFLLYLFQHVKL